MKDFVTALGLLMILEGLPYFISPDTMKEWLQKLITIPSIDLRHAAMVSMFTGLLLIYLVRG